MAKTGFENGQTWSGGERLDFDVELTSEKEVGENIVTNSDLSDWTGTEADGYFVDVFGGEGSEAGASVVKEETEYRSSPFSAKIITSDDGSTTAVLGCLKTGLTEGDIYQVGAWGKTTYDRNLLDNSDFETWSEGSPTGWTVVLDGGTIEQSTDAYDGTYAVKLTAAAEADEPYLGQVVADLEVGANIEWHASHKTITNDPAFTSCIFILNGSIATATQYFRNGIWNEIVMGLGIEQSVNATSFTTYQEVSGYLQVPASGSVAIYGMPFGDEAVGFYDNVELMRESGGNVVGLVFNNTPTLATEFFSFDDKTWKPMAEWAGDEAIADISESVDDWEDGDELVIVPASGTIAWCVGVAPDGSTANIVGYVDDIYINKLTRTKSTQKNIPPNLVSVIRGIDLCDLAVSNAIPVYTVPTGYEVFMLAPIVKTTEFDAGEGTGATGSYSLGTESPYTNIVDGAKRVATEVNYSVTARTPSDEETPSDDKASYTAQGGETIYFTLDEEFDYEDAIVDIYILGVIVKI